MCKTQTINLIESEYLAEGNTRRVYLHPDRDDVIIKIAKPNNMPWLKRYVRPLNRRFGPCATNTASMKPISPMSPNVAICRPSCRCSRGS